MQLSPRALARLLRVAFLALLICVAAVTTTVLHAASTNHDTDAAAAAIVVLDSNVTVHTPDDGGGVAECLGAAMICVAAIGSVVLVTAQARRASTAFGPPSRANAPPAAVTLRLPALSALQSAGPLRI
ncbi:hypothetical protein [Herbiconiux sp. A18JL235]|uniref:Uncharacterized protein n=1 Tax=Herbiconiux sp. A18JL235 TaxID=3152363 RepID=A0AB39BMC7_9MICO